MKSRPRLFLSNKLSTGMEQSLLLLIALIVFMMTASTLWISWIRIDSQEHKSKLDSTLKEHAIRVLKINQDLQLIKHHGDDLLLSEENSLSKNKEGFIKDLGNNYFYLNELIESDFFHGRKSPEPRTQALLARNFESRLQMFSISLKQFKMHAEHLPKLLEDIEQLIIALTQIQRFESRNRKLALDRIDKVESNRYQYFLGSIFVFFLIGGYLSYTLYLSIRHMMRESVQDENQIRSLMNSTAQAIYSVDLRGICTFCNSTCIELLGYQSEEDLIGKNMHSQTHHTRTNGEPYPENECKIVQVGSSNKQIHEATEVFWKQDGTSFHVEYWAYPLTNTQGKAIGKVVAFFDITARLKTQEQLSRYQADLENMVKERTQRLNQTHAELVRVSHKAGMSEVAGNVLHNVGNVLNSLNIGADAAIKLTNKLSFKKLDKLAELLTNQMSPSFDRPLDSDIPKYLKLLAAEMEQSREKLISEMISLSVHTNHIKNIIATQQRYAVTTGVREDVDIGLIIDDALSINTDLIEQQNIIVRKDYSGEQRFNTQQHKLLQILINLISNAAKVLTELNPEGHPKNEWSEIEIVTTCTAESLNIQVSDNGPGINNEDLDRIFNLGVTSRKDGHGLGLHIGATMAQELGGKLIAENNQSEAGATFTLSIPRSQ